MVNPELKEIFGNHLRKLRNGRGISQETLGLRCGIHPTNISLLERGKRQPKLSTMLLLCAELRIQIDELLAPFIVDEEN